MTPVMEQYLRLKAKHRDEVLFFRMGDFYEMFFDDAREASALLGLTLTSRARGEDGPIPMAGVPHHSAQTYVRRLLELGKKVAICEQLEDPATAKGLVERDVVEVVTPGTVTETAILPEAAPNHLLAAQAAGGRAGLAWIDLAAGRLAACDVEPEALAGEVARLDPAECLLPEGLLSRAEAALAPAERALRAACAGRPATPCADLAFERAAGYRRLCEHFRTATLAGFDADDLGPAIGAAAALVAYVASRKCDHLRAVSRLERWRRERHLLLDPGTRRALELVETSRTRERAGSLLHAIDRTRTAMGARRLREWLLAPLRDLDLIRARQDAVEELARGAGDDLDGLLEGAPDLERLAGKLAAAKATPRDVVAIRLGIERARAVAARLGARAAPLLRALAAPLGESALEAAAARIGDALREEAPLTSREGGVIREGRSPEVDGLRALAREGAGWLARFQREEAERTGIPNLRVGVNQVFGYFIEVTNSHRAKVPAHYARRQTLKNAERYATPELRDHEAKVSRAKERADALEHELFVALRTEVERDHAPLAAAAAALAEVDALASLARTAVSNRYVRPVVDASGGLEIEDGRHPVLERTVEGGPFIPNDCLLGEEERRIAIVTGPNMAGKSTFCRQVALIAILAHMGSFVPARAARVGAVDRVFTRIGAADELARGLSTFMVEMTETAAILSGATRASLVILDEVGRGTSTYDGISLAFAITEHLAARVGARTLFATHYHELAELALSDPRIVNLVAEVKEWEDEVVFLRKVVPGAADKSYGLHVARLAGLPRSVLERAKEVLAELERGARAPGAPGAAGGRGPAPGAARERQLDLFAPPSEQVLEAIRRVDIASLPPLKALNWIAEWQERLRDAAAP